jgi:hypothetical protein
MRHLMICLAVLAPLPALAQSGPVPLGDNGGKFGDWTGATYGDGAAKACYAFTMAQASSPSIPNRGQVMLTVTERSGAHDEVTLSAGYTYPHKPNVTLDIDGNKINFYTKGETAFTTQGGDAVTDFQQGSTATATSSMPGGGTVTDVFSLAGFSDAYSAITAACP